MLVENLVVIAGMFYLALILGVTAELWENHPTSGYLMLAAIYVTFSMGIFWLLEVQSTGRLEPEIILMEI